MREPTIEECHELLVGKLIDRGQPALAYLLEDMRKTITRLRRKLEIADRAFERIQNEGDMVSNAIATQALDDMEKIQ